jgi:hypothetical protein
MSKEMKDERERERRRGRGVEWISMELGGEGE